MEVPITSGVRGTVGVLGGPALAAASVIARLREPSPGRPDAVEVRADLFELPELGLEALRALPRDLPAIFTVRRAGHGGRFDGAEPLRVRWCLEALDRGASLVDLEWDTEAARELAGRGVPLVVSHHDFDGMPDDPTLEGLTAAMAALRPRAIKLVPTAARPADSIRMLRWAAGGPGSEDVPRRVGFAMGPAGIPSRVLAPAWGGAWTYGALAAPGASGGPPVAPGIPSAAELQTTYRAGRLSRASRILAVAGPAAAASPTVALVNRELARRGADAVCLPFQTDDPAELIPAVEALPIVVLRIEPELREAALLLAGDEDRTARAARAADALVVERSGTRPAIRAFHRGPVGHGPADGGAGDVHAGGAIAAAFDLLCHLLGEEPTREGLERFAEASGSERGAGSAG